MPSFDIVSTFEMQEIDNAINMVKKDIANRYDFKGSNSNITLNKSDNKLKIEADNEYQIKAIIDMLENRAISRKISIKTFKYENLEQASGMSFRKYVYLQSGISKEDSKKINKLIKELKLKVNSQILGDKLRVTGKKIDDLQNIIKIIKKKNISIPLQFINMKT